MSLEVLLDSDDIAGDTFTVSVQRGRSLETGAIDAGTATIVVENESASFNPYFLIDTSAILLESGDTLLAENGDDLLLEYGNGTGGGEYGEIVQGRKITVKDNGTTVYVGFVEDYDYEWKQNYARATLTCVDALATLAASAFNEWLPAEGQLTGARVSAALNRSEVQFPSGASARDIATGTQPLAGGWYVTNSDGEQEARGSVVSAGTNALSYTQTIADTENGRLFVGRTGKLVFQDRYESFGTTPSVSFDDTGSNIEFAAIAVRFGTEALHFQVSVDREGGTVQTATNQARIDANPTLGARHLSRRGMLFQSDDHSLGLASFLLSRFDSPIAVISGLTIELHQLSAADREDVCELDIGDVVSVAWTPPGTDGPVTQTLAVEGIDYDAWNDIEGTVTLQLSEASDPGYFVLDTDALDGPAALAP